MSNEPQSYEPYPNKTIRDWVLGIGEFSEENLRKSREEFARRMAATAIEAMEKQLDAALGRQIAAKARTDAATGEPGGGEGAGNTQKPVAWGVVRWWDNECVSLFERRDQADFMSAALRKQHCHRHDAVPLYRQPQPSLTQEERSALQAVVSGSDVLKWQEIEAVVRSLLERTE